MITNTTNATSAASATSATPMAQADARSDMTEPMASKTVSEFDLESRIKVRRAELIGRLGELKTNARLEAVEAAGKLKARLSELAHIVKEGVVDGWASLGDTVKHKLEHWLAESALLPTNGAPVEKEQS